MGRKSGSYKFEKRQKELKKQKKKQEKLERRQSKGAEFEDEPFEPELEGNGLGIEEEPTGDDPTEEPDSPDS